MNFTPKSEKQLQEEGLIPEGIYPFEVLEAVETTSKKGNPMIELKLRVFYHERSVFVTDYLMESMGFKLRHGAVRLGLEDEYNIGCIQATSFVGKEGWAKIAIQKDKNGSYPDRNIIKDYVEEPKEEVAGVGADAEDDIPFN